LRRMANQSPWNITGHDAIGGDNSRSRPNNGSFDEIDYRHRHFVNLVATAFLLVVSIAVVWTIKAMDDYEKQRRCLDSGRRECVQLDAHRHLGVRESVR
jgi:hypothetical protein